MTEPVLTVQYAPNYPGLPGEEHAFFVHFSYQLQGDIYTGKFFMYSHPAASCFIDHNARLGSEEITEAGKLEVRKMIWEINNKLGI